MIVVTLTNVSYQDDAAVKRLRKVLDGKTYMNLEVTVCPAGGYFEVCVQANHSPNYLTEKDVSDMVISLLTDSIMIEDD